MKNYSLMIVLGLFIFGSSSVALADEEVTVIENILKKMIPGEKPDSIMETPIPGFFEVAYGPEIMYMTKDARYMLKGDIVDLKEKVNLTEEKRSTGRQKLIKDIDPASMIIFKPEAETKYVVNIFTDIDCGYCRKLHREISSYTDRGIEIRYLAYPRSGLNTESYYKAVSVWCSEDRNSALTIAKSGGEINSKACESPVIKHMSVANKIGVTGTPTIVLADGSVLPGYVPAGQLSQVLAQRVAN